MFPAIKTATLFFQWACPNKWQHQTVPIWLEDSNLKGMLFVTAKYKLWRFILQSPSAGEVPVGPCTFKTIVNASIHSLPDSTQTDRTVQPAEGEGDIVSKYGQGLSLKVSCCFCFSSSSLCNLTVDGGDRCLVMWLLDVQCLRLQGSGCMEPPGPRLSGPSSKHFAPHNCYSWVTMRLRVSSPTATSTATSAGPGN